MSEEANAAAEVPAQTNSEVIDDFNLQAYYIGWFGFLLIVLFIFKWATRSESEPTKSQPTLLTNEFKSFQRNFVMVYLFMMAADWLQGPYVYALYKYYEFNESEIGVLFIIGFGASMVFGTFAGSMADKYGRKKMCLAFGILYSLSCLTKHYKQYEILLIGRLLGGISTSILFSSFESWMIHEHHQHAYPEEWMGLTFSICTQGNGITAIAAGVLATLVREQWGPVAPFDTSLVFLVIGSLIIAFTWAENTGDSSIDLRHTIYNAFTKMRSDPKIWLLGVIQSFFESAMYIFVFKWTPALETSSAPLPIFHGWIFASFMICTLIGSGLFAFYLEKGVKVERLTLNMLFIATLSLIIPAFSLSHSVRLLSFFLFEVCVGLFWPSLGFLRSRYVPEEVRATVMNFFRIPLNLIVVCVLYNVGKLEEQSVFLLCSACLFTALLCEKWLCQIVFTSANNANNGSGTTNGDNKNSNKRTNFAGDLEAGEGESEGGSETEMVKPLISGH